MAGRAAARPQGREESPDRKGHPPAEIAEGSNLFGTVTENNRPNSAVEGQKPLTTTG